MTADQALPKPARQRGRIAPVKLAHAVMRTGRYREMVDWYARVLEAETVFADPMFTFLTYDEEHHRVAIVNMPGLLPRPRFMAGVEHVAFTYAGLGDLLATYRRLKGIGIMPYWCINHGGTTSMYYADPDGNQVELQIDNFESIEELNAFLHGPDFAANPIGIDFDPEALCARHAAGEPTAELVRWRDPAPRGADTIPVAHLGRVHAFLARLAARRR
jgi:catechol 2,3-dioxygenase-like lactoylglutathione lyase family enzyme